MKAGPRRARWVPLALFVIQLVVTALVIGVLSFVFVVQLTLVPGAIFGEYDGIFTTTVSWGVTGVIEVVASLVVFVVTGLVVGILGLPVRLIPSLRRLWLANGEVTLVGMLIGVTLLVLAYLPFGEWQSVQFENGSYPVYVPNAWPFLIGWLLLALSLSLVVWPARWLPRRARDWWIETQSTRRPRVPRPSAG